MYSDGCEVNPRFCLNSNRIRKFPNPTTKMVKL